ncbi:MAG: ribonuclease III [Sphaerochaetaceae bacterium]|nr:ribonuclease III [Sphaerochaetaceae bacterium]
MFGKRNKAPAIPEERLRELLSFQKSAGLNFRDISILHNAFVHSSYANEAKNSQVRDNERLEFLGDSVLQLVISDWLYTNLCLNEGDYTRIRSFVVNEDSLSNVAENLHLDRYILIGKGEEMSGGRHKKAILADCTEAVFAAVYLDRDYITARDFILKNLSSEINDVISNRHKKDYKTLLQEYVQKKYKKVPEYTLIRTSGPDHDQQFYFNVTFNGRTFGPVGGHNKKDAEQAVAKLAWQKLGFEEE